jgi:hypothetical protein
MTRIGCSSCDAGLSAAQGPLTDHGFEPTPPRGDGCVDQELAAEATLAFMALPLADRRKLIRSSSTTLHGRQSLDASGFRGALPLQQILTDNAAIPHVQTLKAC